jgi:hypothetical protein
VKKNKLSEKQPKQIKKYLIYYKDGDVDVKYWNGTSFDGVTTER